MAPIKHSSRNIPIIVVLSLILFLLISIPVSASTSATEPNTSSSSIRSRITATAVPFSNKLNPIPQTPTSQAILTLSSSTIISPSTTITNTIEVTPTPFDAAPNITAPITTSYSLLPFIYINHDIPTITPSPVETVLFCDDLNQPLPIPDDDPNGVNDYINLNDDRLLINLGLYLDITHQAVGNLVIKLNNQNTGEKITALYKPGIPSGECTYNDVITILDDRAAQPVSEQCASAPKAISGIYRPADSLGEFSHKLGSGTWMLNVSDQKGSNIGTLNHWCLKAELSNLLPQPTPPPTPVPLPSSAYVDGMWGENQQLELDCESRAAVDWARHFGFYINELDFLYNLPTSDDPEAGFVGNPDGAWGNIPPDDYGVHAPPVAGLLQDYGLTANPYKYLRWDELRAEIASGHPAIVWIIGGTSHNLVNGIPVLYTPASTGNTTVVARHEHTVIVVGYTPTKVTILNGSQFVDIPLNQFLDSWSVLQFQAILARP